jgi:hypothetical protein
METVRLRHFPQRGDTGGEIGRIRSREPHVRHLGMRVEQKKASRFWSKSGLRAMVSKGGASPVTCR